MCVYQLIAHEYVNSYIYEYILSLIYVAKMNAKTLVMKIVSILIPLAILNLPTGGEGEVNVSHSSIM